MKINEKTDYGYLFNSLNNSNNNSSTSNNIFNAIDLSEYHNIKSGVYGKALKVYYAKEDDGVKNTTKVEKDDKPKTATDTAVDKLTDVDSNASALANSAKKLIKYGSESLFNEKEITVKNEDGTTKKTMGYDVDAIYNAVSDFTKKYNAFITSMNDSDSKKIVNEIDNMTRIVNDYKTSLEKIGITIDKDNKLSVAEDAFKKADMADAKKLFNGHASFASVISEKVASVGAVAKSEANVMKNYNNFGGYENSLSSMGNLMDNLI